MCEILILIIIIIIEVMISNVCVKIMCDIINDILLILIM